MNCPSYETKAALRLVATDRRTVARRIFIEIDQYLINKQFNNLDNSISFKCELRPVLTVLQKIGFKPSKQDDTALSRDGVNVKVTIPRDEWHPVLSVI